MVLSNYCRIPHNISPVCVARASVCLIVQNSCRAIVDRLMPAYIKFPSGDALSDVVEGFEQSFHFPQCAGAIDGSHIPITPRALNHTDYYNRKGSYSVILQAVVDHRYLFRDMNIGWPGSVHDARVLVNSALFKKGEDGMILKGHLEKLKGEPCQCSSSGTLHIHYYSGFLNHFLTMDILLNNGKTSIIDCQELECCRECSWKVERLLETTHEEK